MQPVISHGPGSKAQSPSGPPQCWICFCLPLQWLQEAALASPWQHTRGPEALWTSSGLQKQSTPIQLLPAGCQWNSWPSAAGLRWEQHQPRWSWGSSSGSWRLGTSKTAWRQSGSQEQLTPLHSHTGSTLWKPQWDQRRWIHSMLWTILLKRPSACAMYPGRQDCWWDQFLYKIEGICIL